MIRRILIPAGWLIAIYLITVLSEDFRPPPENFWQRLWFETYHVLAHGGVYAIQAGLIAGAVRLAPADIRPRARSAILIVGLIAVFGLGQEVLQSVLRHEITLLGSTWDILVDASGAAAALWAYARSGVLRLLAGFPSRALKIQESAR